jgi:4,5-DOPA dioxygenase extradiol
MTRAAQSRRREPRVHPTLFLSHGAPTLALSGSAAARFLQDLGRSLKRPKAILVASAHWETEHPAVSGPARNETIHDFRGFPAELHAIRYPAPGAPDLAREVRDRLVAAGLQTAIDPVRGLDHGAWVPLALMYPQADIPVAQISVQPHRGAAWAAEVGRALSPLREDVLIVGSGSFTHDLGRFRGQPLDAPPPPDTTAFAEWIDQALVEGRREDLLAYRERAPFARANHPTEEHLLPLFTALGAGGGQVEKLHQSTEFGILYMNAYAFS